MIETDNGYCAPNAQGNYKNHGSCFSHNELVSIASLYNTYHHNDKSARPIPMHAFKDAQKLLQELALRLKPKCQGKTELCWLQTPFINRSNVLSQLKQRFRPTMPSSWISNRKAWLNTFDILDVMKQYEGKYPSFGFLGVFPLDFRGKRGGNMCVIREMCTFTLTEFVQTGKTDFGMVINLDTHDKTGSHWVAMYGCVDMHAHKFGLSFFDSTGRKPDCEILEFMKEIKNEVEFLFPNDKHTFKVKSNPKKYQHKNTECGMYSMLYIIACLETRDKTYKHTRNQFDVYNMRDDRVNALRKAIYVPPDKA